MSSAKCLIESLRKENIHQRHFVPDQALQRLLTAEFVLEALTENAIDKLRLTEIAATIVRKGKKIFAILILIDTCADISKFIAADDLHDGKLPFRLESLENEYKISKPKQFEERQWEFLAPVFCRGTLNRCFRDKIVLPFVAQSYLGKGAFGKVYRLNLQTEHQTQQDLFPQELVLKELEKADDHLRELHNLAILNHLRHPNVVELLSSYTYHGNHNLLFASARHGDLASLFKKERQDTHFHTDSMFLAAFARLSSAIEHIHTFFEQKLDLKLIGCHHDLKPSNILVSGSCLVLADFGISRFKNPSEDSNTPFRGGMGDYLAPECEDPNSNFEPQWIRRSSDIWSFGCILLEAAIYMALGADAIKRFKAEREVRVRGFKLYHFHNGPNKTSDVVRRWLMALGKSSDVSHAMLILVIRKMLSIEPRERPTAAEVAVELRAVTLANMVAAISQLFERIRDSNYSFDMDIEHLRFKSWVHATGIPTYLQTHWRLEYCRNCSFESNIDVLNQIERHLEQRLQHMFGVSMSSLQLAVLVDELHSFLGMEEQEIARIFFTIFWNPIDDDPYHEDASSDEFSFPIDTNIRLSASLKHMTKLMEAYRNVEGGQVGLIDSSNMRISTEKCGEHNRAQLRDGHQNQPVIVEWRRYGHISGDQPVNSELYARLGALARVLSAEKPKSMRALSCKGYFHEPTRQAFGMIYALPYSPTQDSSITRCINLQQWIKDTTGNTKLWPTLDDKFKLAYQLARSILDFHIVGWLHKNLNSSNIAFFDTSTTPKDERVSHTYIIGFDHSRQNDPTALTVEVNDPNNQGYQHPNYRRDNRGYKPEYDYYSLGVLLMEIGYWRPLKEIAGVRNTFGNENDKKLRDRIPQLKQHMGRAYCEAVEACIDGDFGLADSLDDMERGKKILVDFETKVLRRLTGPLL